MKRFFTSYRFQALAVLAVVVPMISQAVEVHGTSLDVANSLRQPAAGGSSENTPIVPARVVDTIDDTRLTRLTGNTHPEARPQFDKGPVDPNKMLQRIVLVLKRSPEQEAALAAFNERQYDPNSPDFHHWLHADEFGKLYGINDADLSQVTSWLQNHGFAIHEVSKGKVWVQFDGTVKQVEDAFHLKMRNYLVDGKMHIANDRDPEIPQALAPVITGIASLNDFRPTHFSHPGAYVKRDLKTGKYTVLPRTNIPVGHGSTADGEQASDSKFQGKKDASSGIHPDFTYTDPNTGYLREELSPYDVATIYNILPLWNESTPINGKGVKVAIVALSDVETSDFNTYRSSFGLPAGTLTTLHSGADPGITDSQGENTEDTEMVSATAPGASVILVADANTATTDGLITAVTYIVDKEIAPILTMSYGACELKLGTSGNSLYSQTFQQAATAGITSFVAAGDSGSAVCTSQDGTPPYADQYGLAVSGMASNPYVTAVGGTDLQWPFVESTNPPSTYWNATNDSHGASAKGYMPEMAWNDTCTNPLLLNVFRDANGTPYSSVEALCNDAINGDPGLVEMAAGSGGKSNCTTNSTTDSSTSFNPASCSGGYAKPSWQSGVTGIPNDGKRDLPDVSFFAAYGFQQSTGIPGSALLICQASASPENSCDYSNPDYIIYQENGGTSAASPLTAGVMALVLQKIGGAKQGLANPVFYSLAAKESYSNCNSNTVKAGNSCIFYDTTAGSNAAVCYPGDPNCVTKTSGDEAGVLSGYSSTTGYDLATGLGSFNVANLVNAWPTGSTTQTFTVSLSPTSLTFPSTKVGATSAAQSFTLKNTGTGAIKLGSVSITGTNASSFLQSSTNCPGTVNAGASCTVSLEFKPTVTGSLSATWAITDNATNSPQKVTLSGTATNTTSTLTLTVSPTSLSFPSTAVGSTSGAQAFTLKNTGTQAVKLGSVSISGNNASSFLQSSTNCPGTIAAGASCSVDLEFKPTTAGTLTATWAITDNATNSPQKVALTGTATSASTLTLTASPSSLTFGSTKVGSTSAAQAFTLKNTGTGAVKLGSVSITGTNASSFLQSSTNCPSTVAAGASCTVDLEFKPSATGSLSATWAITDNATNSPQKVSLKGTGD